MGPVYDELAHLLLSPVDLLPVVGLAVRRVAGSRARPAGRLRASRCLASGRPHRSRSNPDCYPYLHYLLVLAVRGRWPRLPNSRY